MEHALDPTADPAWTLIEDGYDPLREGSVESRFAISNGFLGVRGSRATTRGDRWVVPPRTYVAGLFDTTRAAGATPGLIPAADWLKLRLGVAGGKLLHHPVDVAAHRMTLDLRRGALLSESRWPEAGSVGMHLRTIRLVSLSARALGLQVVELEIEGGDVDLDLEASFEGTELGLVTEHVDEDGGLWRTPDGLKRLAIATAASVHLDGQPLDATTRSPLGACWHWSQRPGQVACFHRLVALRRGAGDDVALAEQAHETLARAVQSGWRSVVASHEAAWTGRWRCSDVELGGDKEAQRALRFALYHLNGAADPGDPHVSIGARALTGSDYHGHVFWDTEIFLLPFYTLTWPEAARALLMYRFHTLGAARAKAAAMGWRGALYAWESAETGAEMTPEQVVGPDRRIIPVLCGSQEQHISADIAYAVWQYWSATGDEAFLLDAGAEILLETGRFWASRAQPEPDGLHHICGVIGPDEYHEGIDDNAFTNVMARWNIRRAVAVAGLLRARWPARWTTLSSRLAIDDAELAQWSAVADTMATGLQAETGLFEQFRGYLALEDIDLATYTGRSVPLDVVLGHARTQASQVVKQADVVALLMLLPDEFPGAAAARNYDYYAKRCGHGSSLSRAMHGVVAARLGQTEAALAYYRQTAAIDLADTRAATDGGVHIAALGGLWMTAVLGFAGVCLHEDAVRLDPRLPAEWRRLAFPLQWRGRHLAFSLDQDTNLIEVTLAAGAPMPLIVRGSPYQLANRQPVRVTLDDHPALAA